MVTFRSRGQLRFSRSRAMLVRQYLNYWHGHGCNCDTHVAACVIERFRLGVHTTNVNQEDVI